MLNDVTRMFQREIDLIAFHCEDSPVAARQGMDGIPEMYRVGSGSEVIYHVTRGYDAQPRTKQYGSVEDGFEIRVPVLPVALTHVDEVFPVTPRVNQVLQLLHAESIVKKRVMLIPLVDDTTPACPSPN